jgi:hypothetical protein
MRAIYSLMMGYEPLSARGVVVFLRMNSYKILRLGFVVFFANPEVDTDIPLGIFVSIFHAEMSAILY